MRPEMRFYHLTTSSMEKALPSLVAKIVEGGHRAVIMSDDAERLKEMDNRLWTFSQSHFIPHGTANDPFPEEQVVYLTQAEETPNNANVLILLGDIRPELAQQMTICADMFDGADHIQVEAARKRWTQYRDSDAFELTYWKQDAKGKWEKQ